MWSFLKGIIGWLLGLIVREAITQVKEEVKKPNTITDEKTPDDIRHQWNDYVDDQLRDKRDSH